MSDWQLKTPVAFLIFNRPETTAKVFAEIARAKPPILLVVADGPRAEHPAEIERCQAARAIVEQRVDWPCEVLTNYAETNLGCRNRVSSGLDWVFESVQQAIILEDDCLPHPSFFRFCGELLARYADDTRIGMISGNNYGFQLYDNAVDYSFSRHGHIWGWATWKRAWQQYRVASNDLTAQEIELIRHNISDYNPFADGWWRQAEAALEGELDSWDYIWGIARYASNFLTIRPRVNLVATIGFGEEATHTRGGAQGQYVNAQALQFPLVHPRIVVPDRYADKMLEEFRAPPFNRRVTERLVGWTITGIRRALALIRWPRP